MKASRYRLFHRLSFFFLLLLCLGMLSACSFELITPIETTTPHTHEWGEFEIVKQPSCTQSGEQIRLCDCGGFESVSIPPLGHTEEIDPAVAPSCTETGLTEGAHCALCNEILTKHESVAVIEHTVVIDPAVSPSCTETGLTEGTHCSACGTVLVAQETVKATGHSYSTALTLPTCTEQG